MLGISAKLIPLPERMIYAFICTSAHTLETEFEIKARQKRGTVNLMMGGAN